MLVVVFGKQKYLANKNISCGSFTPKGKISNRYLKSYVLHVQRHALDLNPLMFFMIIGEK